MAVGEPGVQRQQRLGRRPVGAVDEEGPVETAADQRQPLAERREPRLVVAAILLGAADDMTRAGLGIDELGAAGEGEGFLDRIDDLDEMGAGAGADDGIERRLGLRQGIEEIAEQGDIGEAAERASDRASRASARARNWAMRSAAFRARIGSLSPRRPTRSPAAARSSVSASRRTSARSRFSAPASRERKSIEPDRSAHSHIMWAASHSFSRTKRCCSSRAERRQSMEDAASPGVKGRNCQNVSPRPGMRRPCQPAMTVAETRRASIRRSGRPPRRPWPRPEHFGPQWVRP